MQAFLDDFTSWLANPFSVDLHEDSQTNLVHWVLLLVLLLVIMILWRYLFVHIRGEFE